MVSIHSLSNQKSNHTAVLMYPSLKTRTYEELDDNSIKVANYLYSLGIKIGMHIAIYADNCLEYYDLCWAAQRSGIIFTCIPYHLTMEEAGYIIKDCGAQFVAYSDKTSKIVEELKNLSEYSDLHWFSLHKNWDVIEKNFSKAVSFEEIEGSDMLYSSGTTGRPKGIKRNFSRQVFGTSPYLVDLIKREYNFTSDSIYLSPAPLYHAAPLKFCMAVHRIGGTVICMEKFSALDALKIIDTYKVTHSQWVPTMLLRMYSLSETEKKKYNISSLKAVIHAASPCSIDLKINLINWFGKIVYEYYASTEGTGFCTINSEEWLKHKGSVGKSIKGKVRICNMDNPNEEIGFNKIGLVYFSDGEKFIYHNDIEKTNSAKNNKGWLSVGDIGYLDVDDYLYLTDRLNNVIISGGVNVYPQEIETLLSTHSFVSDIAVIGKKDDDLGEIVHAIIVKKGNNRDEDIKDELIKFCKENISNVKSPKSWEFRKSIPREDNGKLYKNKL